MTNTYKLTGISLKGKNRIREHGEIWIELPSPVTPPLVNSIYLQSVKTGETRWVLKEYDPHFQKELIANDQL